MIVHHIKMNEVGPGCLDGANFIAKPREISRKQARRTPDHGLYRLALRGGGIHDAILPLGSTMSHDQLMQDKNAISVSAEVRYLPEHSDAGAERYVFAYTITIRNSGASRAQLISRHWIITDANDKTEEVRGPGVVGKQPMLEPGDSFQYTSGAQISSPVGTMHGSYQMQAADGTLFDAPIAPFTLAVPRVLH